MQKQNEKKEVWPAQHQNDQPGDEYKMHPKPDFYNDDYKSAEKLSGKKAVITGGDSGIGRAVAAHFAAEGADVAILYLEEDRDAKEIANFIKGKFDKQCLTIRCDIRNPENCRRAIEEIAKQFGTINILVNNAAVQFSTENPEDITDEQLENTFQTNIFSMFYLVRNVLPKMKEGDTIINTASVTAYRGSAELIDYASTKGAIISFTRSLASNLADRKIRVNAVAPGPIWTPLIPSSFDKEKVKEFGTEVPLKRAGQPFEIAPSYVFLASQDSSYMTGQVLHPNGGEIVNS